MTEEMCPPMITLAGRIESGADQRANTDRLLTHSLDLGEEGLAVNATRTCTSCHTSKPLREFTRDRRNPDGCGARCLECERARSRCRPRYQPDGICTVDGCEKRLCKSGLCRMHLARRERHGDPLTVLNGTGPSSCNWVGDNATYYTVHNRLRRQFGSASAHPCVDCGRQALHWSYNGGSLNERRAAFGCPFTPDLSYYSPRCMGCHKRYDHPQSPTSGTPYRNRTAHRD